MRNPVLATAANNEILIKERLEELRKQAVNSVTNCLIPGCQNRAIQSHLLQKKGILNKITNSGHLWRLDVNSYKAGYHFFNRAGLNNTFTFKGFCKKHDDELFKHIETGKINPQDYRTQLLFAYRAVMNEMRKKEINIKLSELIQNDAKLKILAPTGFFIKNKKDADQERLGVQDEKYYLEFFEKNLNDSGTIDFEFFVVELPEIEICVSCVFTFETTREIALLHQNKPYLISEPLTEIYLNLIPIQNKSIIIIGCLKVKLTPESRSFIESFTQGTPSQKLKKISDLLLSQVENWVCSDKFYDKFIKGRESEIYKITNESLESIDERRELNFNLFEPLSH